MQTYTHTHTHAHNCILLYITLTFGESMVMTATSPTVLHLKCFLFAAVASVLTDCCKPTQRVKKCKIKVIKCNSDYTYGNTQQYFFS